MLIRFKNTDEQLAAREIVSKSLSDNYIVALNLAPATPEWMRNLGMHPLKLGLDLRGGVHFLMEVDMDEAMKKIRTQIVNDFRTELRNNNLRLSAIKAENDYVLVEFRDENTRDEAVTLLSKKQQDFVVSRALIELYKDGVINNMRLSAGTSFSSIADVAVKIAVSTASPVANVAPVTV